MGISIVNNDDEETNQDRESNNNYLRSSDGDLKPRWIRLQAIKLGLAEKRKRKEAEEAEESQRKDRKLDRVTGTREVKSSCNLFIYRPKKEFVIYLLRSGTTRSTVSSFNRL